MITVVTDVVREFQSTRPIRGATLSSISLLRTPCNFNPRAPYGARQITTRHPLIPGNFNPRAPYGARHYVCLGLSTPICISIHAPHTGRDHYGKYLRSHRHSDFNPRAPYGARPRGLRRLVRWHRISIHAPHTGRDHSQPSFGYRIQISIHAPHTGRDGAPVPGFLQALLFQSTRPIRGATMQRKSHLSGPSYFNPRAPYGARPDNVRPFVVAHMISIHAPHTGRDRNITEQLQNDINFNPRAPYGARPFRLCNVRR